MITYSFHAGESMKEVAEYLMSIGQHPPNPMLSVGWLAKNDSGIIVGVIVIQSVPLCEPCIGTDGQIVKDLFERAEKWIRESKPPRVFMHTAHPAMKRMLRMKGAMESCDEWYEWNPQEK